jgi:hypothetical protein
MTGRPKSARAQITHFCVPEMLIAEAPAAAQIGGSGALAAELQAWW